MYKISVKMFILMHEILILLLALITL